MNTKLKKTLLTLSSALGTLAIVTTATYAIGTLTPSGSAGDDTQYSLNDIYTKLTTGDSATLGTGTMTVPGTVSASFRTLTEIYDAIPDWQILSDTTTTVTEGFYEATDLATVDTDLTPENIADGVIIFGITGENTGPALVWSAQTNSQTWTQATLLCSTLTEGTVPAGTWRLPTIHELEDAIAAAWAGGDGGAEFADEAYYWSGTEFDGSKAWLASWFGFVNGYYLDKTNAFSVRCVR